MRHQHFCFYLIGLDQLQADLVVNLEIRIPDFCLVGANLMICVYSIISFVSLKTGQVQVAKLDRILSWGGKNGKPREGISSTGQNDIIRQGRIRYLEILKTLISPQS